MSFSQPATNSNQSPHQSPANIHPNNDSSGAFRTQTQRTLNVTYDDYLRTQPTRIIVSGVKDLAGQLESQSTGGTTTPSKHSNHVSSSSFNQRFNTPSVRLISQRFDSNSSNRFSSTPSTSGRTSTTDISSPMKGGHQMSSNKPPGARVEPDYIPQSPKNSIFVQHDQKFNTARAPFTPIRKHDAGQSSSTFSSNRYNTFMHRPPPPPPTSNTQLFRTPNAKTTSSPYNTRSLVHSRDNQMLQSTLKQYNIMKTDNDDMTTVAKQQDQEGVSVSTHQLSSPTAATPQSTLPRGSLPQAPAVPVRPAQPQQGRATAPPAPPPPPRASPSCPELPVVSVKPQTTQRPPPPPPLSSSNAAYQKSQTSSDRHPFHRLQQTGSVSSTSSPSDPQANQTYTPTASVSTQPRTSLQLSVPTDSSTTGRATVSHGTTPRNTPPPPPPAIPTPRASSLSVPVGQPSTAAAGTIVVGRSVPPPPSREAIRRSVLPSHAAHLPTVPPPQRPSAPPLPPTSGVGMTDNHHRSHTPSLVLSTDDQDTLTTATVDSFQMVHSPTSTIGTCPSAAGALPLLYKKESLLMTTDDSNNLPLHPFNTLSIRFDPSQFQHQVTTPPQNAYPTMPPPPLPPQHPTQPTNQLATVDERSSLHAPSIPLPHAPRTPQPQQRPGSATPSEASTMVSTLGMFSAEQQLRDADDETEGGGTLISSRSFESDFDGVYNHYNLLETVTNIEVAEQTRKLWRTAYAESRKIQSENWDYFVEQCKIANVDLIHALSSTPGHQLILDGIPLKHRAKIWADINKLHQLKQQYHDYYPTCLMQFSLQPPPSLKAIKKDVTRTMQYHELFQSNDGIEMLINILSVFSFKNPRIGYCQSMNLLCAALLLFYNEEDTFWSLDYLLNRVVPQGYYSPGLVDVKTDIQVMGVYMKKRMPKLTQHLEDLDIDLCAVCIPWFMCLYMEILPMETTMRIWDIMFVEQHCAVIIRVALAIFYLYHDMLLECTTASEVLLLFMTCTQSLLDCDEIIRIAHQELCYVSRAQVDKRRKQLRKAIEKEYLKSVTFLHSS